MPKAPRARGLRAIIAGAGGAAHLPGMLAAKTIVPVLGVPVPSKYLRGEDSLLSHRADAQGHAGSHVRHRRGRARPTPRCLRCAMLAAARRRRWPTKLLAFRAAQTEAAAQHDPAPVMSAASHVTGPEPILPRHAPGRRRPAGYPRA